VVCVGRAATTLQHEVTNLKVLQGILTTDGSLGRSFCPEGGGVSLRRLLLGLWAHLFGWANHTVFLSTWHSAAASGRVAMSERNGNSWAGTRATNGRAMGRR